MSTKPSTGRVRSTYEFIKVHRDQYSTQMMCRVLGVAASGYYAWLQHNRTRRHSHLGGLSPEPFEAVHKPSREGLH
jgi:putative transposase